MAITRRLRRTAMAMAVGAGAAYFLDPAQGSERRREVSEKLRSMVESRGTDPGPASGGLGAESDAAPTDWPLERPDEQRGTQADPTGGAAPIQGRPTVHSADVMG